MERPSPIDDSGDVVHAIQISLAVISVVFILFALIYIYPA
jgi:hypothetical protein